MHALHPVELPPHEESSRPTPHPRMPLFQLPQSVASQTIVVPNHDASVDAKWMPLSDYCARAAPAAEPWTDAASLCSSESMCSAAAAAAASPTRAPLIGAKPLDRRLRWKVAPGRASTPALRDRHALGSSGPA